MKNNNIGKFKIKEIEAYIKEHNISDINATMLITLCKLANYYLDAISKEGALYKYTTAEGLARTKRNPLIDSIIPTYSMINQILKANHLTLPKKAIDNLDEKEDISKDEIDNLIQNITEFKNSLA